MGDAPMYQKRIRSIEKWCKKNIEVRNGIRKSSPQHGLLPDLFSDGDGSFLFASIFTGAALFIVGALRAFFSRTHWPLLGFEMLAVGGTAAAIAYGIGFLIRALA